MEYVDGVSLNETITQKRALPEAEALKYIRQTAGALDYIHKKKINHLDIKPANILLRNNEDVVLIDFGLSKQYDAAGEQTSSTPVGVSLGYTPIEQSTPGGVRQFSAPTDIYSLGATLYKLVTGKTPPAASDVMNEGLPSLPSTVGKKVATAIQKAMEPGRKKRPQNIHEFLNLLDDPSVEVHVDKNSSVTEHTNTQPVVTEETKANTIPVDQKPTLQKKSTDNTVRKKMIVIGISAAMCTLLLLIIMWIIFSGKKREVYNDVNDLIEIVVPDTLYHDEEPSEIVSAQNTAHLNAYTNAYQKADNLLKQGKYANAQKEFEAAKKLPGCPPQNDIDVKIAECKQKLSEEQRQAEELKKVEEQKKANEPKELPAPETPPVPYSVVDDISQNMVYIEEGAFMMGSNGTEALPDEQPVHQVTISSFYIGKYEVTQAQWEAVMESNPSSFKGSNLPVENVSWNEVQDFIHKLNALSGKVYRLPTEAEWEYAARGGNKSGGYNYSGSDNAASVAWFVENSNSATHAVGTKSPNEIGLCDMNGNVREWCSDWYGSFSNNTQTNPQGPSTGTYRVARGGSWAISAWLLRVTIRFSNSPGARNDQLGFRLVSSSK